MDNRYVSVDVTAMALIYRKVYKDSDYILFDKVEEYLNTINDNLNNREVGYEVIDSNIKNMFSTNLYYFVKNNLGEVIAILNDSIDINFAWNYYIGRIPFKVIVASQEDNALEIIGLKEKDSHKERILNN